MGAGGQRTEPATPHRRREARKKGQVARTAELGPALMLLAAYGVLRSRAPGISDAAQKLMRQGLQAVAEPESFSPDSIQQLFATQLPLIGQMVAPVILAMLGVAVASQMLQVGVLFTAEPLRFRFDKLNPLTGLQRLFSRRSLAELVKSLCKVSLIGYMGYKAVAVALATLPFFITLPAQQAFAYGCQLAGRLTTQVGGVFLLLALADYIYQRWDFEQNLRMTRKEVEDELKQSEGDPQLRGKIRQRQRQVAMRRMMQAVPQADVVVTNPTHLAVALRYDAKKHAAPLVVAKGAGLLAERIKELAKSHRVPVVENVELAQALYYGVELNGPVPAQPTRLCGSRLMCIA